MKLIGVSPAQNKPEDPIAPAFPPIPRRLKTLAVLGVYVVFVPGGGAIAIGLTTTPPPKPSQRRCWRGRK